MASQYGTGLTVSTFVWNKNKKVCSDHFHPNCSEENRMSKMLGYELKPNLKPGAIPTLILAQDLRQNKYGWRNYATAVIISVR